ncbi:DNA-processing protein DprA [Dactylosporangium sp. NPDC005555]|uniref:DNA-processing protein DprA n=1 Tax=Dactylosporangium sp. NPDC005555 TaxID=3154889 RepID=UPI0033B21401
MTAIDDIRAARAALGWLFEPGDPAMVAAVRRYGPVEALDRLTATTADGQQLRHEVRHLAGPARTLAARAVQDSSAWCRVVIPEDVEWPTGLDALTGDGGLDPVCLWVRGSADLPVRGTSVTVTGARAATAYGHHVTTELAYGVAGLDRLVVSTADHGVGVTALQAAAAAGGSPVAVLSCGLQHLHPAANTRTLQQVADGGLLLSAWPPDARPARQRSKTGRTVLAALTGGTVVVEDHPRGAALDVVRHALGYGRAGMLVPGAVTSVMSAGSNALLRDDPRARVVCTADDIIRELRAQTADADDTDDAGDRPGGGG